jgi:subtilisin family serine protease
MNSSPTQQGGLARRIARAATACLVLALAAGGAQASALMSNSWTLLSTAQHAKIAHDLRATMLARTLPSNHTWARDQVGPSGPSFPTVRYVKALVFCDCADSTMADLRQAVLRAGGTVYMRYLSVRGLSVMLPTAGVIEIARRAEVQSISPNRLTTRSFSVLEQSVNVSAGSSSATPVRAGQAAGAGGVVTGYLGRTGAGVGIAILDSGIMRNHDNFRDAGGATRVRQAVDFTATTDASVTGLQDWKAGLDASVDLLTPGSPASQAYGARINNYGGLPEVDGYGHGTHVAAVAAGRAWGLTPNSTGVAPGALLYDLKVLDNKGFGTVSDVLAAIDWVVMRSRELNIRVMNLSLAADSTESYVTDPLCRAVRSASALGITVVVAAGNFGKRTGPDGRTVEVYGTVGSPGIEPSVITVGSANPLGTGARTDDSVNHFSSKGPSRGVYVSPTGQRRIDNALKPDLVAPGNKIVASLAAHNSGAPSVLAQKNPGLVPPATTGGRPTNRPGKTAALMSLSGTSVAAPAVAGTVALMLEANPGLTPPLTHQGDAAVHRRAPGEGQPAAAGGRAAERARRPATGPRGSTEPAAGHRGGADPTRREPAGPRPDVAR